MGSPYEKRQRERDEKIRKETLILVIKIIDMLKQGIEIEVISKETEVKIEHIKRFQRFIWLKGEISNELFKGKRVR